MNKLAEQTIQVREKAHEEGEGNMQVLMERKKVTVRINGATMIFDIEALKRKEQE